MISRESTFMRIFKKWFTKEKDFTLLYYNSKTYIVSKYTLLLLKNMDYIYSKNQCDIICYLVPTYNLSAMSDSYAENIFSNQNYVLVVNSNYNVLLNKKLTAVLTKTIKDALKDGINVSYISDMYHSIENKPSIMHFKNSLYSVFGKDTPIGWKYHSSYQHQYNNPSIKLAILQNIMEEHEIIYDTEILPVEDTPMLLSEELLLEMLNNVR
jgi:hypothetical protein